MADQVDGRIWAQRAVFVLLALLILAVQLAPLRFVPAQLAGPDLLLAAILVWVLRQPEYLPVVMIAAIVLLADLLLLRPPGLWAACVVALSELLRRQHAELRHLPFLAEWGTAAAGIIAVNALYYLVLALFLLPVPSISMGLIQAAATITFYPVIALIAAGMFGQRSPANSPPASKRGRL